MRANDDTSAENAQRPILIMGAGINGVAIARQLLLNGQSAVVVDRYDIAFGATAYSSRLIHGGLRYLEYAEFRLVKESLDERTRLLQLAPQFVKPLQLFIPGQSRLGGVVGSATKFLQLGGGGKGSARGTWLVQTALSMYDWFARGSSLPKHRQRKIDEDGVPQVDPKRYRWLTSYYDAQIQFPERFVLGMIEDCKSLAQQSGLLFDVHTYCLPLRETDAIVLRGQLESDGSGPPLRIRPRALVNATGAFVDQSLATIDVPSDRLMGGTKGSHLVTHHAGLRQQLASGGIYAEASDGRPVFVLPFGEACLIGTTDIFFDQDPADAVASDQEIDYLVSVVNTLFPQVGFQRSDVHGHYCGVRPLPYCPPGQSAASVTRSHVLHEHSDVPWPMISVVGGKLTTCRQLAQEATQWLATELGFAIIDDGRQRCIGGHSDCRQVCPVPDGAECIEGTDISVLAVDWILKNEYVRTLSDLVLRRLMLVFAPHLRHATLAHLAQRMVAAGLLAQEQTDPQIQQCEQQLQTVFGKTITHQ